MVFPCSAKQVVCPQCGFGLRIYRQLSGIYSGRCGNDDCDTLVEYGVFRWQERTHTHSQLRLSRTPATECNSQAQLCSCGSSVLIYRREDGVFFGICLSCYRVVEYKPACVLARERVLPV